ncbi:MAG: GntR family transcriptional regulator [Alicyclobacillus herbarius]|uniref:GntR family transcriptional regulator n=1 Tax=Alicyclobacillus herbarius TaxID=122960 RepID=UPI00047E1270|nr:GntR family transcriptional regulator [Alicyclobacillus herbarius]MCL6632380.1 GntR family transcriptional regulator [Alicyclobacillus herbarius]
MQIKKPVPVNQQIYDFLFRQIMEGTFSAGTRLAEERIAAQLGVSRTPVRESILRLEHEGLLRNKCVIEPTFKEVRECYEIRILLESYAARQAATFMEETDKKHLKSLIETSKSRDFETAMRAHTEFHNLIVRACGNDRITHIIERMQAIILLCRRDVVRNRVELPDEHGDIFEAVLSGDGDLAESLMRQHLVRNYHEMLNRFGRDAQ